MFSDTTATGLLSKSDKKWISFIGGLNRFNVCLRPSFGEKTADQLKIVCLFASEDLILAFAI